ncbi:MAG: hypothetical protein FJW38_01420 [Acidobacteria bacterium]|nr:hypothetical protein [Acidobacteriota bacterium]
MLPTDTTQRPLPFRLTEADLPDVILRFRVSSTKLFSGYDEILIRGNGQIGLRTALKRDSEPTMRVGSVDPKLIARLLQYLSSEGLEEWDESYPSEEREYVGKLLTLTVRDQTLKQVSMCQPEFSGFSRACGAIKLVAAMGAPEAINGEFFQRI